jgi:hypothetical protein
MMQFKVALLSERQLLHGPLMSEDEAVALFAESAESRLSATCRFRMSLHNKMYNFFPDVPALNDDLNFDRFILTCDTCTFLPGLVSIRRLEK